MRINNNIMAINTHRQLGMANAAGAKSMEKLSSGLRVNRAADDAAGLSISEKMRNQVRGLNRASSNSQDGISLIQTAEGALDETHSILKRMRELVVQSGNEGTLQEDDLEAIKDEFSELTKELDGISHRTEFNGKKLLDGKYNGILQIGANQEQQMDLDIFTKDIDGSHDSLQGLRLITGQSKAEFYARKADELGTNEDLIADVEIIKGMKLVVKGTDMVGDNITAEDGKLSAKNGLVQISVAEDGTVTVNFNNAEITDEGDGNEGKGNYDVATYKDVLDAIENYGPSVVIGETESKLGDLVKIKSNSDLTQIAVDFEIDASSVAPTDYEDIGEQRINGSVNAMDLGVNVTEALVDENGQFDVEATVRAGIYFGFEGEDNVLVKQITDCNLERMDAANKAVSKVRSHLGANQNRLEHTIKNLDNAAENIQAAESRIRDVDMAKEMIENTRQNILQQASTAMLAQANMAPQSVLQLLG